MVYFWQILSVLALAEAVLFVAVAAAVGVLPAMLGLSLSVVCGLAIVRRQGLSAVQRLSDAIQRKAPGAPEGAGLDALCLLLAGCLFLFPGFLSDALAFLLLVPRARRVLGAKVFGAAAMAAAPPRSAPPGDDVIDVPFRRVEEPPEALPKKGEGRS